MNIVKSEMAANQQQQEEQRELREPAHHARRPMNAFLIFCKRHRGSVRSGFPHLENRAVTRVLGEWWATLHPDQKRSYTNLAQEYKDAFLNANPDFKWYKLPAPPLRTLTTRPSNKKAEVGSDSARTDFESNENDEEEDEDDDSERRRVKIQGQSIQPGKLADESQIGGLSSLFTPVKTSSSPTNNVNGDSKETNADVPKPPKKRYTEQTPEIPLPPAQKKEFRVDLFGEKKKTKMKNREEYEEEEEEEEEDDEESNNNNQHLVGENPSVGNKTYYEGANAAEDGGFRGERTCKGLRYQKFLAEQLRVVGPAGKQTKRKRPNKLRSPEELSVERRNSISSNFSEKTDSVSSEGGSRGDVEYLAESAEGKLEASKPEETETEGAGAGSGSGTSSSGQSTFWTPRKRFKAEDFNLEKKIEALPSLSLEEFQEKKKQQRTKKKKILQKLKLSAGGSRQNRANPAQLDDQTERKTARSNGSETQDETEKALLIGSQKRKARKQSITRNAAASSNPHDDHDAKQWCASPDLEALACLAEVAANRTKLTK